MLFCLLTKETDHGSAIAIPQRADTVDDPGILGGRVRAQVGYCIGASDEVVAPNPAEVAEHFAGRIDPRMAA